MCARAMASSKLIGKTVVLGVGGGIAAYKAAFLASLLTRRGAIVKTVMTAAATEFITPLTLQSLTRQPVYTDVFDERNADRIAHIDLADSADLVLVAPATADLIARAAAGMADDMLTATLLATRAPVLLAPAMNVHMWDHPLVRRNLATLQGIGMAVAQPGAGPLACGYTGTGRLMEPDEIVEFVEYVLADKPLAGKRVLVTAGPTRERIDPVRYLTNDSTGTMGYALAQAAWRLGATVTLVSGSPERLAPMGVDVVPVFSAADMKKAVLDRIGHSDLLIKAAAVADYRPETPQDRKIKKQAETITLQLTRNDDILSLVSTRRHPGLIVVGFAAETHDGDRYARAKLVDKNLDALVLNNVLEPGAGFGEGSNRVTVYFRDGRVETVDEAPKLDVAFSVLHAVVASL